MRRRRPSAALPPRHNTGLLSFVGRHVDVQRLDELVVDTPRGVVMRFDEDDKGALVARPNRAKSILRSEVSTADVVEPLTREPVSRDFAAAVLQFTDRPQRRSPSTPAQVSHLAVGDGRQRDLVLPVRPASFIHRARSLRIQPTARQEERVFQRLEVRTLTGPQIGAPFVHQQPDEAHDLGSTKLLPFPDTVFIGGTGRSGSGRLKVQTGRDSTFLPSGGKGAPTRAPASAPDPVAVERSPVPSIGEKIRAFHNRSCRRRSTEQPH